MPFIHPGIFLLGLGGAAVPIIIHLLSRRRYRLRDWAAMEFIRQAFLRN
ncbi:MAG: BatA domain-containing protein, partial [Planctomycetota bacterium]